MTKKKNKASVLIVALIILGVILVTTLSISLVAVRERKASIGSSTTNVAYQNAETGIEAVMNAILNKGYTTAGQVCSVLTKSGVYTASLVENVGSTEKTLDACGADTAEPLSNVASIKSVGNDATNQEQRAIEAAVAAGPVFSKTYWQNNVRSFSSADANSQCNDSSKIYPNNTGKPIYVNITVIVKQAGQIIARVGTQNPPTDNFYVSPYLTYPSYNYWYTLAFMVPSGSYYCAVQYVGASILSDGSTGSWLETY